MMISRLRKRVVAVLMAALLLMTLSIMGCTIVINARQHVERQKELLRSAAIMPLNRSSSRSYRTSTPYFVVRITPGGKTDLFTRGLEVEEEEAFAAAEAAQAEGNTSGVLEENSLRYLIRTDAEGSTRITFISTEEAALQLHTQIITCLILTPVLMLVLFLGVVLPLSRWLTRPVQQAWEKQKQFIADASHELKTPLTVILANLSILARHGEKTVEQCAPWIDSTREEAQQMRTLVEEMLTLARLEGSQSAGERQMVNLSDMLNHCLMTLEPLAFERGITLRDQVEENLTASCSETSMRRLMTILLDNAMKYAGGEKQVWVTLAGRHDRWEMQVGNTGDPIPPQQLPHLFDRFYQGDETHTGNGFGLGLAIARQIAEMHSGTLTVRSTREEGTVFTLSVPGKVGKEA